MKLFTMTIIAGALGLSACTSADWTDFVNGKGWLGPQCGIVETVVPMYTKEGFLIKDDQAAIPEPCIPKVPPEKPVCTVNCTTEPICTENCGPVEQLGGNPGNGKPVGGSPWDGITGNSHKNDTNSTSPKSATMDGQRNDQPHAQPGGKDNNASNSNK